MFKLNVNNPNDYYDYCYSEYFTEKYPDNFFDYYIDIGCCGITEKWHINHMGKNNPNTICIGFEVDTKSYNILKKECESLKNVILYNKYFGRDMLLSDVIKKHNIDINKKICISCDCEGDEKYLFKNNTEINLLKNITHLAFEIHPRLANISYNNFIKLFKDNFNDTHKIVRTFHGGGGKGFLDNSSLFIVKYNEFNNIINDKINNLKYNFNKEQNYMIQTNGKIRKEHSIVFLN